MAMYHFVTGDVKADFDKAKHMMAEKDFLKKLKDFDPTTVSAEQKAVLADQLKKEAVCEDGAPSVGAVKKASAAGGHLMAWLVAIDHELA